MNTEFYNRLVFGGDGGVRADTNRYGQKDAIQRATTNGSDMFWFWNKGPITLKREELSRVSNPDGTLTITLSAKKPEFVPSKMIITGERTGLHLLSLRDFILYYGIELEEYYGEYFTPQNYEEWCFDNSEKVESRYMILCLVDLSEGDCITEEMKKKIKKAGGKKREGMRHRHSYANPFNRIHGFVILTREHVRPYTGKKVLAISTIASTPFSDKKGIGSDMMDAVIRIARDCEYDDIILEVSNEYAGLNFESDEDEELSDDEDDEETYEGYDIREEVWYPTNDVMDIIAHELWRKTMRRYPSGVPYYNVDEKYIREETEKYFYAYTGFEKKEDDWKSPKLVTWMIVPSWNGEQMRKVGFGRTSYEDEEKKTPVPENPLVQEYGGENYQKGKESQKKLIEWYMGFGFVEDPSVHLDWQVFSEIPYPTLRLNFNEYEVGGYERPTGRGANYEKKIKTKRMKCRYIDENKKIGEVNWEPCC